MPKLLHALILLFTGLLLSQSAFAQVVSWSSSSTQNIPLGGVSTILMILTMLGLGTFIFPKLKSSTLKSFFMMFMVGGMLAVASSGGMLSSVNAANSQVVITTASGSQHIIGGTTDIINNYSQTVQLNVDPQECTVSTSTSSCATSQSLPAGQGCSVVLNCNTPPVGESFTFNAYRIIQSQATETGVNVYFDSENEDNKTVKIDLSTRVSDADGDSMEVVLVSNGLLSGDLTYTTSSSNLIITVISTESSDSGGSVFVDFKVTDGSLSSPTYRITIEDIIPL